MESHVMARARRYGMTLTEAIGELRIHDHLCLIYESREEQFATVIPFMGIGLERGEKCVYIADDNSPSEILEAMVARGIDTDAALRSGALTVFTKKESYLREGYFDPELMIRFLGESVATSRAEGFAGLRVTGEMTWALGSETGVESLLEYESRLNVFFPDNASVAICQYNRRRFPAETIRDIILTHPLVIHGDRVCRNLYFVPPDEFLGPERACREVERLLRNIRQAEEAEEALSKSEERFRRLADNAQDVIYRMSLPEGRYEYMSPSASRLFGYSPDDFYREPRLIQMIIHPDWRGYFQEAWSRLLLGDMPPTYEYQIIHRSGEARWLNQRNMLIRDDGGRVIAIEGIVTDVTERKVAEEALVREKALLRCVIDSPGDLIFIKDRDGVYLGCNRASEEFIGMPESEQIGKTDFDFFDREKAMAIREFDRQVIAQGKPLRTEEWVTNRKGVRIPLDTLKAPYFGSDGEILGLVGICRDISERRNLENQLRLAQKMEAVGTLAGGVAHEFNNIMTAVIGYGSLIKMRLADDPALLPKVDALLHAADRAAVLVQSLLSFSRNQRIELGPTDLNELVSRVADMLRRVIREDIELELTQAYPSVPVRANGTQIEQILVNLLSNSQDAMPRGGRIEIGISSVELDSRFSETHGFGTPGRYALITFSDSGEGMDEKVRQKIFEPFFTTKEVGKGTGLGLSICYGIIKQHSGYIVCDSEQGRGTTFRIYLPMIDGAAIRREPYPIDPLARGSETILIAEDNEGVRSSAREILEECGYRVIEAVDGKDALAKVMRNGKDISLIIMDVVMPRMNGWEVYGEVSRICPGMRVIFSSGHNDDILPAEMKGLPFISKPYLPERLLRIVRDILDAGC